MKKFNSILQKVSPIWKSKILSKYKRPGRRFTRSRIIEMLEPLLAKAMPLPKERLLSQEEVMCLVDATEESIERLRRELERKIPIRGRRSHNYHMIVVKTGLGRECNSKIGWVKGGIIHVWLSFHSALLVTLV